MRNKITIIKCSTKVLNQSTQQTDSAPFIEFMLSVILEACKSSPPHVSPHATPQVIQLLNVLKGEMSPQTERPKVL